MAEDWATDVKRYVPDANDATIAGIVRYCGIALRKRDSSLVSFGDAKETARVRDNYCRKKLGLTDGDDAIDAMIAAIGERMKGDATKNRVTVYYLLAESAGKLGLFAATAGRVRTTKVTPAPVEGSVTASAAAVAAAAPLMAAAASASAEPAASLTVSRDDHDDNAPPQPVAALPAKSSGYGGIALATLGGFAAIVLGGAIVSGFIGSDRREAELPAYAGPPIAATATPAAAPAPAAVPEGSGVIAQTIDGMPKVSVYFDTGKTDIASDFATVAAPVKAWADANPGDRIGVSGFNDPTGNAALNAELSKNRAQAVAAALTAIGVPADRIDLDKPPETTDANVDMSQARRVDIVVKDGG